MVEETGLNENESDAETSQDDLVGSRQWLPSNRGLEKPASSWPDEKVAK